jgi:hypothetical protein
LLNRREFGCTLFAATSLGIRGCLAQQGKEFICSTVDRLPNTSSFTIKEMANAAGLGDLDFDTKVRQFSMTEYGVSFLEDRWRRTDGLTPNHPNKIITLGIFFMDGTVAEREAFRTAIGQWLDSDLRQSINFDFSANPISFASQF